MRGCKICSKIRPIFEIVNLAAYADDNYMGGKSNNLTEAIEIVTMKTQTVIEWMTLSGLKIYESKTEICIFHRNLPKITNVSINNKLITTKNTINILGIVFDSQLKWNDQSSKTIKAANKNLYTCRPRWSSGLIRHVIRSWMRKVEGSNPGEAHTGFVFFCRDYID